MKLIGLHPFNRRKDSWHGKFWSLDNSVSLKDFKEDDVEEVVLNYSTDENDWDGQCAAVLKLKDGRYITYETSWGPTGNGFSEDAYGGEAGFYVSTTLHEAVQHGLSPDARQACWDRIVKENLPRKKEVEDALVLSKLGED